MLIRFQLFHEYLVWCFEIEAVKQRPSFVMCQRVFQRNKVRNSGRAFMRLPKTVTADLTSLKFGTSF